MASISTALRNVLANAVGNSGAGINFDLGILEIRSGAAPGPNAEATGVILASMILPADAFGAAVDGVISKAGTWEDTDADATGTAQHFRIRQAADTNGATGATDERIEGTVDTTGADLNLDSTSITVGQVVTVNTFTVTMPIT